MHAGTFLKRHLFFLLAVGVFALSGAVFVLAGTGALSAQDGFVRALVIPAWIALMVPAVLNAALSPLGLPLALKWVVFAVGLVIALLPFAALDKVRANAR